MGKVRQVLDELHGRRIAVTKVAHVVTRNAQFYQRNIEFAIVFLQSTKTITNQE